MIADWYGY